MGYVGTNRHKHNKVRRCQTQPKFLQGIDTAEGRSGWIDRDTGLIVLSPRVRCKAE